MLFRAGALVYRDPVPPAMPRAAIRTTQQRIALLRLAARTGAILNRVEGVGKIPGYHESIAYRRLQRVVILHVRPKRFPEPPGDG